MRRKPGSILPLEVDLIETALTLRARGVHEFHGYLIAQAMRERRDARSLTSHGTLYKALGRMRERGWLSARWEDPAIAAEAERPRRRLYAVTPLGETVYKEATAAAQAPAALRRETQPS
ncbi:MAG: PadR family transcriptional regulator [Dehalococcoidia bacterium]